MAGSITNDDIKSIAELTAAGAPNSKLPNDTKVWVTSLSKTLDDAIQDGDLAGGGGGAGSPDTIFAINADNYADLTGWATGDNVITEGSALPGGALQGTLEIVTVSPAEGTAHFRYTQAAGSLNSYWFTEVQTVPEIFRGKDVGCSVSFKYDGADNDILAIVWDETNDRSLTTSDVYIKSSTVYKNLQTVFTIPSTCTQIRVGFQVKVLNSGKILNWDNFFLFDRPFVMANVNDTQSYRAYAHAGFGATNTFIPYFTTVAIDVNNGSVGTVLNSSTLGWSFTARRNCYVNISWTQRAGGASIDYGFSLNSSSLSANINTLSADQVLSRNVIDGSGNDGEVTWSGYLASGDILRPQVSATTAFSGSISQISITANAQNESIITPASNSLVFSAETTTPTTILYQGPENWLSSISNPSTGVYDLVYTSGLFSLPPVITGIVTDNAGTGYSVTQSAATSSGCTLSVRNDAGGLSNNNLNIIAVRTGNDSRSASRALVASPVDRVCKFLDLKADGTAGGSASAATTHTRTITNITGDTSFCSLSSNQLTISTGTYHVFFSCPAFKVNGHQATFYNVTDSSVAILAPQAFSDSTISNQARSEMFGEVTISTQKVFEVRHYTQSAKATDGLGVDSGSSTLQEIYTWGWIKKVK